MTRQPVVVALDFSDPVQTLDFVSMLDPAMCRLKIGKELFTRTGPVMVEQIIRRGFDVFLDLKFHDIPNTVARACAAAAELGVWMMNVHTLGGRRMLEAAREAVNKAAHKPLLIGVTLLTSLAQEDLADIGLSGSPEENVLRLAHLAQSAGLDGVVCSPWECAALRATLGADFKLVTPGIRLGGGAADDQRRVMTPGQAIAQGSSYLVIGRPVTAAPDPMSVLLTIKSEIDALR
jgi:orotidine-5'-phosphate decarboxylase